MKTTKHILATITTTILLGWTAQTQAQWNAYNDFYLSPTASGWSGATSPSSALGTAWGYYMGNVNGFGLPTQIGAYFTTSGSGSGSQSLYRYSNYSPLGSAAALGQSLWDPTGGAGFARYTDNQGWGSSLGRYDNPWFGGAPAASNRMWMQSGWLGGGASEGIASILTWTAAETGTYQINTSWQIGNNGTSGGPNNRPEAAIAIVTAANALLARTVVDQGSSYSYSYLASFNAGDTVQFQVGNNFQVGAAVGLSATVTAIPEPSSAVLLTAGLGALGLINLRRRR